MAHLLHGGDIFFYLLPEHPGLIPKACGEQETLKPSVPLTTPFCVVPPRGASRQDCCAAMGSCSGHQTCHRSPLSWLWELWLVPKHKQKPLPYPTGKPEYVTEGKAWACCTTPT